MITYIDLFLLESYYIKIVNYKTDKKYGKINDKKERRCKTINFVYDIWQHDVCDKYSLICIFGYIYGNE